MKRYLVPAALLAAALSLSATAGAQPAQPMPTSSTPVAELLADAPHRDISNGLITARLATVDGTRGFYRGTRFDQAGQVFSLTLNGREFYGPWFDAAAPDVLDYAYDAAGQIVAGPDSAAVGPVEEFAPLNFSPATGSHFVKIGVGILYQPDTAPYDHDKRHIRFIKSASTTSRARPRNTRRLDSVHAAAGRNALPFSKRKFNRWWRQRRIRRTHAQ